MLLKLYRQASIKVQKQRSGELKLWSLFSSILYNRKIRFIGSYTRLGLRFFITLGTLIFFKCGPMPAFFVYFRPILITISIIQIEKSINGVLGFEPAAA